jgi:hypothetical protein
MRVTPVVLTVAAGLLAAPAPAAAPEQARERQVLVSVTTAAGAPLADLQASDVRITEDGRAREVLAVAPAPPPSHLALLVDDSAVTQHATTYVRDGFLRFARAWRQAAPVPDMAVVTFGERPTRRADFSTGAALTDRALGRLFALPGSGSYLLEALIEVARDLRKRQAARPVIVAFVAEDGPEFSAAFHRDVAEALRLAGASLWTVTLQMQPQTLATTEARERAQVLGDVGTQSGGINRVIVAPLALAGALDGVRTQLLGRWQITYSRPDALIPPSRLDVDITRRDVRVRATRWPPA